MKVQSLFLIKILYAVIVSPPLYGAVQSILTLISSTIEKLGVDMTDGTYAALILIGSEKSLHPNLFLTLYLN